MELFTYLSCMLCFIFINKIHQEKPKIKERVIMNTVSGSTRQPTDWWVFLNMLCTKMWENFVQVLTSSRIIFMMIFPDLYFPQNVNSLIFQWIAENAEDSKWFTINEYFVWMKIFLSYLKNVIDIFMPTDTNLDIESSHWFF